MVEIAKFIPWVPGVAAALCGLCALDRRLHKLAGWCCVLSILVALVLSVGIYSHVVDPIVGGGHDTAAAAHPDHGGQHHGEGVGHDDHADTAVTFHVVHFFTWLSVGSLEADFSYFVDPLTMVMLFVVTGIGLLIAIYATGYMKGDPGYARFFAAVALFIFAMLHLVMADNLILLFLGWEGVGLCSYLLIGYYYKYDVAVAAAKKAFIVNRIGDLGFALGIFLTYIVFGSVQFEAIIPAAQAMLSHADAAQLSAPAAAAFQTAMGWGDSLDTMLGWIPFLLMIGAFGKSAQIPLFVWLPDAMAGPTPVSALVHAATMVTSGVYLIARLTPIFALTPSSLATVAIVGAVTSLFAATIALCSNDLKGVFAYSTVSQLGYMFIGAALISVGGVFHLFTHAFFKALLFLTAGSVMHALAGSLDIRTMSGLRKKMPLTCWLMFAGCLALAGFPFTAGFYSKDLIIGDALVLGLDGVWWGYFAAIVGLCTAALTAFYTFRLWFRVFMGEERWVMGDEGRSPETALERAMIDVAKEHEHGHDQPGLHGEEGGHHGAQAAEQAAAVDPHKAPSHAGHEHGHAHEPHEMPFWPMNAPLVVLALGSLFGGLVFYAFNFSGGEYPWIKAMIQGSTAMNNPFAHGHAEHHAKLWGMDPHTVMEFVSGAIAISGIALAAYFHWLHRDASARVATATAPLVGLLRRKWYVDEFYHVAIVRPLRGLGGFLYAFDQLIIGGLVQAVAWAPILTGQSVKPMQSGRLQGYGVGMATGVGVITAIIFWVWLI